MERSAMARFAVTQIDPLELERRAYESLFDLMEDYRADHPDASDDECFEAVCFGRNTRNAEEYRRECE
jgi:hypothetical protein